ncbi:hypothetical protein FQN49_004323 [Arthroderma sp. PD_2]|nr:hypothetical protein FQN49_004323 [Arthroderma sp. PD_2]
MDSFLRVLGKRKRSAVVDEFTEDDVYEMHLQDFNFRKLIMACTLRFDHVLDADKLHAGLARLLEMGDWRKLGGRLRPNADGKLEIHVPKQFSLKRPPVTFSHDDLSSMSITDHGVASKLPVPTEKTSIQPNPYNLIELGVRANIPKTINEMVDCDLPQISLHIISFEDATLVSISWPHSVMGSQGFVALLHAWSLVVGGKENEVPRLLGARNDVLLEMENNESQSSRQELIFEKDRLKGGKLSLFILRLAWSLFWNPREVRSVFIPKMALERLQSACRDEMDQKESFDEEVILLAWFAKLAASATPRNKPVTIINLLNARQPLSSMLDQSGAYVQNVLGYTFSFLTGQVARGRLGPLVKEHSRHIREQSTEQQCLSFLRAYRRATKGGRTFKLFYGPSDAHVIGCNSFLSADVVHAVDFSAAVIRGPENVQDIPRGGMTCLYYHIMNNRLGCGPDCIYLLGKDHGENLWVTAALPPRAWEKIAVALEEYS